MNKVVALIGLIFFLTGALSLSMAPDVLSLMIVGVMVVIVALGFCFSMVPTALFAVGFRRGRASIDQIGQVQSSTPWLAAQQAEFFFHQRVLDKLYEGYVRMAHQQAEEGMEPGDIEEVINSDALALRSWQGVASQIPGTLTALGLLGTFIGLVIGISSIGFSSVEAALSSIEVLLGGIEVAFFTSIVGVIYSVLFNILQKVLWNVTMREMGLFVEQFHMNILPSVEEQNRLQNTRSIQRIIELLDRMPKDPGYSIANAIPYDGEASGEQRMMPAISEGLRNGEFMFMLQPRCDLNTRRIIGGEALVRWNHGNMGMVSPADFLPLVEKNGYIVQIDRYIWDSVCKTIHQWIEAGVRPLPVSINVSKTDVLAMDVAGYLMELVKKYDIPPRTVEVEISESAYLHGEREACELEEKLRKNGFRVVIDGFSGDFMGLYVLRKCKADAVKLDLRFINGKSPDVIRNVFEQARKLNCPIIVEGVENAEQLTALRRCGCTEGQGFYLYSPMMVEEFEETASQE